MIQIDLANTQTALEIDAPRLRAAAQIVFERAGIATANLSLAVVDDPTIRTLNRRYLRHDEPTDVLSFLLEKTKECLEGEVIVSAETAARVAEQYDWSADDELLLYVIHGALHLVGYDDRAPADAATMRAAEQAVLAQFGLDQNPQTPSPAPFGTTVAPDSGAAGSAKGASAP